MPRPWENQNLDEEELEMWEEEKAPDQTTREQFYDKMVQNGWNREGDDQMIAALWAFGCEKTSENDNVVQTIMSSPAGTTKERAKLLTDLQKKHIYDFGRKNGATYIVDDEAKKYEFKDKMEDKGWNLEGDDRLAEIFYKLPNRYMTRGGMETFRDELLKYNVNGAEDRKNTINWVINYHSELSEFDKESITEEELTYLQDSEKKYEAEIEEEKKREAEAANKKKDSVKKDSAKQVQSEEAKATKKRGIDMIREKMKQLTENMVSIKKLGVQPMFDWDELEQLGGYDKLLKKNNLSGDPLTIAKKAIQGPEAEEYLQNHAKQSELDEALNFLQIVENVMKEPDLNPIKEDADGLMNAYQQDKIGDILGKTVMNVQYNDDGSVSEIANNPDPAKSDRDNLGSLDVMDMLNVKEMVKSDEGRVFFQNVEKLNSQDERTANIGQRALDDQLKRSENAKENVRNLNTFRRQLYRVGLQNKEICKLGTDKEPVYVRPLPKQPEMTEKLKTTEGEVLDNCYKMLEEPTKHTKRDSAEYKSLMRSVKNTKQLMNKDGLTKEEYVKSIRTMLNQIDLYRVHKAKDGVANDATLQKLSSIERMDKLLQSRYKSLTGKDYVRKNKELFEVGNDKVAEHLKGDKYLQEMAKAKIDNIKVALKTKVNEAKLAAEQHAAEQHEAEKQVQHKEEHKKVDEGRISSM